MLDSVAFVFPGQGSQAVGMMRGFDDHPAVRATFDDASQLLGQDLWGLVTRGPEEALDLTVNTQPVMLTAAIAVWRAWAAAGGPKPAMLAGHSLGEYSALVASGAVRPVVGRRITMAEVPAALDDHEQRRTMGRTVVDVAGS